MPWYVLQDYRGWTMTTHNRSTAETMFRRLRKARGDKRLRYVQVDGKIVWPTQMRLAIDDDGGAL